MTRSYKTNYRTTRKSSRFHVTFDAPKIVSEIVEACTICGGKIEEVPMMRGVCYSCYQNITKSPEAMTAYRNHAACLLAETMRDCDGCKFQPTADPRTAAQIAADEWEAETLATREADRPY